MAFKLINSEIGSINPLKNTLIGGTGIYSDGYYIYFCIDDTGDIYCYSNDSSYGNDYVIGNISALFELPLSISNYRIKDIEIYSDTDYKLCLILENIVDNQYTYTYGSIRLSYSNSQFTGNLLYKDVHIQNSICDNPLILKYSTVAVIYMFSLNTIYAYVNDVRNTDLDEINFNNRNIVGLSRFFNDFTSSFLCCYDDNNFYLSVLTTDGVTWSLEDLSSFNKSFYNIIIDNNCTLIGIYNNFLYFIGLVDNVITLYQISIETNELTLVSTLNVNYKINNVITNNFALNLTINDTISLISIESFFDPIQVIYSQISTYTATFRNYDNTLLYETEVNAGETPSYVGPIPTRQGDNLYDYTFTGWNPELAPIIQDTTYIAQFSPVRKQVQVTFENYDGTILEQKDIDKGTEPIYTGTTPTKPSDDLYDYTFSGWEPELGIVNQDTTYTAQYTSVRKQVQVTFENYDGTILEQKNIDKGTEPTYTGTTPTKPSDNLYDYTFNGWSPELSIINEDTTYTAQFTSVRKKYQATFRNYDNTLLYETEVNAGETPSYVGPIPTRQGDNLYDYTFTGWNPELAPIIQDTTYIAQFSPVRKQVQVTFKNYDGTILEQKDIDKGSTPTYTGQTPSRPADPYYTYYFKGWEPELGIVMSDTIYTATYSQTAKSYQCKFVDYDGTVISSIYVNAGEYATPPEFKGTQTGYSFVGWNPDPLTTQILEVTTFNAVYVKGIAINLYVNSAENGRVDKTNYLNQVGTLYGIFKEETSIMNPEIIIEYGVIDFNYIYIPLLNRYYYVNEIISVRNNLWKIRLNCDVLMSFKSDILNLECYVSRNEYTYNEYIEDDFLPLEYDKQVEEYIPTTPTNLEPYQFIDNYVVFITTIYSGDTNNFDYVDIKQSTVPFDIPNINPVSTYEQGSTAFKVAQFIPTDRGEGLEQNLSRFIDLIQGDDTVASYILSVVALPINFPSVNNPFWNEIIQRNNLLIGNDELSNIFDIQTDIGKTGAIPMFCNAKFTITGKYGSFLDYEPYTKYEIFLPYYGWLTLNSCDILNKNIYVAYLLQTDSSNGSVYVLTDDKVIFTSTCSIGVQFAISTTNRERINRERDANLINMTVGAWSGVGTMILGGFSKSPMAVGIGANKLVGSITSGITKCMTLMESASSKIGDGVAGDWSPRKVRVRITYPEIGVDDLEKYSKYIGRPLQENYTLNELNGYTIVGGVHVENIGLATEKEKTEIEKTLRSGFILPDPTST